MKKGFDKIGREVSVAQAIRGCIDKQRHVSRNAARDVARKIMKAHPDSTLRPYRCGLCGGFHLTSSIPHGLTMRPRSARAA